MDQRLEPARQEILERKKADIAARLRPVCSNLPEQEFQALVERIATLEVKYAMRRASFGPILERKPD